MDNSHLRQRQRRVRQIAEQQHVARGGVATGYLLITYKAKY
jgi:hypothetical protein